MSDLIPMPRLRRFGKSEEGQALVLAAFGMIVLLMMAGLGVDVGYLKYQKQQMQKAADAAALAGATALINYGGINGQVQVRTAAWSDAAANGFANGQGGVTVAVNNPPQTVGDPFLGKAGYVEVIVSQNRPTFFMRLAGYNSVYVSSRAVATANGSGSGCIYSLDPIGGDGLQLVGRATQISSNCGILVASDSGTALNIGRGSISTTADIGVVGGCSGGDCKTLETDNELTKGIAPFTDPLANVPAPTVPGCDHPALYVIQSQTVPSGSYCGGIYVLTSGNVTFSPGTYYLEGGGLNILGSPNLSVGPADGSTNGVTFYNTTGPGIAYSPINIQGTPSGSLTAPTSGNMAGILFFQDRSIKYTAGNGSTINGSGGAIYTGTLYFPTTGLTYTGAQVTDPYELIIGWKLKFQGDTTIANHYDSLLSGSSPIANAVLVE